ILLKRPDRVFPMQNPICGYNSPESPDHLASKIVSRLSIMARSFIYFESSFKMCLAYGRLAVYRDL
ncbi:MAG: hypothetical protein ACLTS6_03925, partial [Anaerobutyricum sp.]